MQTPHVASGGRYPVLRALAIFYVIGAALAALSAVIYAVYALGFSRLGWSDRFILAGTSVVGGFIVVISLLAVAEVLKLCIDIEHNTRMAMPGRIGMPATVEVTTSDNNGGVSTLTATSGNRIAALDEETAEAALIRGH
jgi:hypothetical protein